jgi:hypothetical protein
VIGLSGVPVSAQPATRGLPAYRWLTNVATVLPSFSPPFFLFFSKEDLGQSCILALDTGSHSGINETIVRQRNLLLW